MFCRIPLCSHLSGPGWVRFLRPRFRSRFSVSYNLLSIQYASSTDFQSQTFWGLVFLFQDPQAGEPNVAFGPLAPWGRNSTIVIFFLFVGHQPRGLGPDYVSFPPLLPISCFLLHVFSCGKSFLLVFRLLSYILAL